MSENENKTDIKLTELAAQKISEIISETESYKDKTIYLRLWVAGGGCAGLQYGFAIDDDGPETEDVVIESRGHQLIIDPLSLSYMNGSVVEYIDDQFGGGFKIENPNQSNVCGCGNSFTAEGETPTSGCSSCSCGGGGGND